MVTSPSNCKESARILAELRATMKAAGVTIAQVRETAEGFEVLFENGDTHIARGLSFHAGTESDQCLSRGAMGKIIREDWGIRGPHVDRFLEQPPGEGCTVDRSSFDPPQHELRLA